MKSPRALRWLRCGACFLAGPIVAGSVIAADAPKATSPAPATPLSGLVEKYTEKLTEKTATLTPSEPVARPASQPVAPPSAQPAATPVSPEQAATKTPTRKPSPSLASLPAPKAAGPLRILLVDDDWSDNNASGGAGRLSGSDEIFRGLVAAAVGGDAAAWSVEIVASYKNGPAFERLRDFNVVIWYTGASYGGGSDNIAVLSLEDEKTARRYLHETGGSFILVSPGYVNNLSYGTTWTASAHPFLTEVAGINGFAGLVQRFSASQVRAHDGSSYTVEQKGAAEPQLSAVNPDGAAIVFTASLDPLKTAKEPVPVAVAHPFGGGRFVYVGFTFENIAEKERTRAFDLLLAAAVGSRVTTAPVAGPATPPVRTPISNLPGQTAGPGTLTVQVSGTPGLTVVRWSLPSAATESASLPLTEQTARSKKAAPAPGLSVKVERWTQGSWGSYSWVAMAVAPGASDVVDAIAEPGSTQRYQVTVTNASGVSSFQEVQYNVPPAQEPPSLSATQQSDGTVILSWPEVPGVQKYQIKTINPTWPGREVGPVIITRATEWRSEPLGAGKRIWSVTSLYEIPGGKYASLSSPEKWPTAVTNSGNPEFILTNAQFWLSTGNDNKELLSHFEIKLYINGDAGQPYGLIVGKKDVELEKNSAHVFDQIWSPSTSTQWSPAAANLENIRQHGLKVVVKYFPNFILDAWKLENVHLYVTFQKASQVGTTRYSEGMHLRAVMDRDIGKLLTERDNQVEFIIDGSVMPAAVP